MVDLSADAISLRLEQMATESSQRGRRWQVVDASPGAISARIGILATASDLCLALVRLGREGTFVAGRSP